MSLASFFNKKRVCDEAASEAAKTSDSASDLEINSDISDSEQQGMH